MPILGAIHGYDAKKVLVETKCKKKEPIISYGN
ncbi:hypothetical protein J2S14_002969 [Lederbergia wuyishanensis]|uniref:Uncharacterized protein n=1 Tax=Lederbergia wuyishanensis TaxID=1347903 RepID=A0ABU0D6Z2_9BACI|nr:hypothetical protein [Lederbergia wuyishanensis]